MTQKPRTSTQKAGTSKPVCYMTKLWKKCVDCSYGGTLKLGSLISYPSYLCIASKRSFCIASILLYAENALELDPTVAKRTLLRNVEVDRIPVAGRRAGPRREKGLKMKMTFQKGQAMVVLHFEFTRKWLGLSALGLDPMRSQGLELNVGSGNSNVASRPYCELRLV